MRLNLDEIELSAPDVSGADQFYRAVFACEDTALPIELRGAGRLLLQDRQVQAKGSMLLNYIVSQPSEVSVIVEAAADLGARILKPAKKGLFGGFSAVVEAPDGAVWKIAAPTKKDTAPGQSPPEASEVVVILAVAAPKASKSFYAGLGMPTDRDYGNSFVDFKFEPGSFRLGLMTHKDLAKETGTAHSHGPNDSLILTHLVANREAAETLLAAAEQGGATTSGVDQTEGGLEGGFVDPDGHRWRIRCE